jgi:hypothetical protein
MLLWAQAAGDVRKKTPAVRRTEKGSARIVIRHSFNEGDETAIERL